MSPVKSVPEIVGLTEEKVPSVIGMDSDSNLVIGAAARKLGLEGRTNTYHFKTELGKPQDDTQYEARRDRAGRLLQAKAKPYWVRNPISEATQAFTPVEAVREYLRQLVPNAGGSAGKLIIGEPPLDGVWRENYRRNIRLILSSLGLPEPIFFPEPFAVYQYYRVIEQKIADRGEAQTVLVIDFGGGTFDCCVIKTAKSGELARSGAHSQPLGAHSCDQAGEAVDFELLRKIEVRAKTEGLIFKEDPIERARQSAQSLWAVENVKIKLSEDIQTLGRLDNAATGKIRQNINLPTGSFHHDREVKSYLTGEDLVNVVGHLWKRHWGETVLNCHRESASRLRGEIEKYDVVLLAGGSAHLPNLVNLVRATLPNHITDETEIVIGGQVGAAVAKGIAVECREQSDKRPELINDRLVCCLLNDLYVRIGRSKSETLAPKVRDLNSGSRNDEGLVYRQPGIIENSTLRVQLEHRFQPRGVLHYWFHSTKTGDDDPLNIAATVVRIPGDKNVDKKFELELDVESDGTITPRFYFKRHGKNLEPLPGQPFNLAEERITGRTYLGVDFGTCNSYVASYLTPERKNQIASYPEYEIARETSAVLLQLEQKCQELRASGILRPDNLIAHARKNELDFVFHSNKIEGNQLSKGQTEAVLEKVSSKQNSKDHREAVNLRDTYRWVIENYHGVTENFALFVREVNRRLLDGIERNAGGFRTEDVTISGVEYQPPPWGSVDSYISRLTKEIREAVGKTSGLELAARTHTKLAAIHPFIDGNGRTARLCAAAVLFDHDLPLIVLNSDDKERYLDTLLRSNRGSIDSLVSLFAELLEHSLKNIEDAVLQPPEIEEAPHVESDIEHSSDDALTKNVSSLTGIASESRLTGILAKKVRARKERQSAAYKAWRSAFEMFRNELHSYLVEIDEMLDFRDAGYELKLKTYDLVNEERFEAFWTRKDQTRTWFCSFEIRNSIERYALMFQFGRSTDDLVALVQDAAPVSCTLCAAGKSEGTWLPLRNEPIRLREIGYSNGELIFIDFDGSRMKQSLKDILTDLVAELLGDD